ncbi:small integral membrane protein 26-like [Festucalex cinctus]
MTLKDFTKWNKIASTVYFFGVWTMIGSLGYFYSTSHDKNSTDSAQNEEERTEVPKNANEIVYKTAHSKTVVIYKKDFVPYTTRMCKFFESFTGSPGTGKS